MAIALERKGILAKLAVVIGTSLFVCAGLPCEASRIDISIYSSPQVLIADGKSKATITATVRNSDGSYISDGSEITFTTTLGTFDHDTVTTSNGIARVQLTSSTTKGKAEISATCMNGGRGVTDVEFTDDSDLASSNGESRWIKVDCAQYLIYSADAKVIQAEGTVKDPKTGERKRAVHFEFGRLSVDADKLQIDLQTMELIAWHSIMHNKAFKFQSEQLRYDLNTLAGTAVIAPENSTPQSVTVTGSHFDTVLMTAEAAQQVVDTHVYSELDTSTSRLVITARSMSVEPNAQIQFKRATIYSDGKKVVSMPLHVMPLATDQLFGEQIMGVSSDGFFLNIPYYYNISPKSTGTIYLRNSAFASAGVSSGLQPTFGLSGSRPGFALDLLQKYSTGRYGNGSLTFSGLTRSEWGAQWTHNQRIDPVTTSYFFVDYPQHNGLYTTSTINRQFRAFSLNLTANNSNTPGQNGYSSTSSTIAGYLQTNSRKIAKSGLNINTTYSWQTGYIDSKSPGFSTRTPLSTRSADVTVYTNPMHVAKSTTLNSSVSMGQSWDMINSTHSLIYTFNTGLRRQTANNGSINLNYTLRYDPLLSNYTGSSLYTTPYAAAYRSKSQHNLTLTANFNPSKKTNFNLTANYAMPLDRLGFFSSYAYRFDKNWSGGLFSFYQKDTIYQFKTLEFVLSRKILGRSLNFYYGSDTHRVRFDLSAGQF